MGIKTMKQLITRLRELEAGYKASRAVYLAVDIFSVDEIEEVFEGLPQLLDRLEKLEALVELTYTLKHIVDHLPQQDEHFEGFMRQTSDKLEDALAALDAKGSD